MKRLALILAACLVFAVPAQASPNAKQVVKAQRVTIAKLKQQVAALKTTNTGLAVQLTQAQADLATRTSERDAANAGLSAQTALTTQAATGALAGLSPDQLWAVLGALYPLMPNDGLCGYSPSFYSSGAYTSYSFTRYVC